MKLPDTVNLKPAKLALAYAAGTVQHHRDPDIRVGVVSFQSFPLRPATTLWYHDLCPSVVTPSYQELRERLREQPEDPRQATGAPYMAWLAAVEADLDLPVTPGTSDDSVATHKLTVRMSWYPMCARHVLLLGATASDQYLDDSQEAFRHTLYRLAAAGEVGP